MLQLVSKDLPKDVQSILESLQNKVNSAGTFKEKVTKAQSLWKSKGDAKGKIAFETIKKMLSEMCVSFKICNYCEQNEADDIEHITSKNYFPSQAFTWLNYLLACKHCNTALKLDKCYILDNNNQPILMKRGTEPHYNAIPIFINPRMEDPTQFMIINTRSFTFDIFPDLSKIDKYKADKTLEILQLDHHTLSGARREMAKFYYHRMKLLVDLLDSSSITDMKHLLTPYDDLIDETQSLNQIKNTVKIILKREINNAKHPSVWYAIKRIESKVTPKWIHIFNKIPEALNW